MEHNEAINETKDERILRLFKFPIQLGIKRLYKYASMYPEEKIEYLRQVFKDREIYLTSPVKFNDPFECRPSLTWHKQGKKLRDYFALMVREKFPNDSRRARRQRIREGEKKFCRNNHDFYMKNLHDNFLSTTGLYCLSQIPDSILMWSHYSFGHSGVVLEFDTTKEYSLFFQAIKVHYSENLPVVNFMEMDEPENYINLLLTKSIDWKYEKEWRIIKTPKEGGTGKFKFSHELLTGVILGARIEPENKKLVLEWVRDNPSEISISQAKINEETYSLDISPLQKGE